MTVTAVVADPRLGPLLPAAALPALRSAPAVYAGADLSDEFVTALGLSRAPDPLPDNAVLVVGHASAAPAGAALITTPAPPGAEVLEAVAVMNRLRSPGGCPWDAEQTHDSLRQYLVEETYELLEAIEDADRASLREELGDVLLQVLFHARLENEHEQPFGIDEVAADLVAKLVHRHPHVFDKATDDDLTTLEHRWEDQKRLEKQRESCLDGVAWGQPALNLVAKQVSRTQRAGLPSDLLPVHSLYAAAAAYKLAGGEPEVDLRIVARQFDADVREAERAARAAGIDPVRMDAETWHKFWPAR